MKEILYRQLAADFCCTPKEVADEENHFHEHRFLEGRRRFREEKECFLKIAVINGKVLFTGEAKMMEWCREQYEQEEGAWFFEAKNLRKLNDRLHESGFQIKAAHPFFIAETVSEVTDLGYEIQWYEGDLIEQFRGDERFTNAYSFCEEAPDVLGVSASCEGEILGMAGASRDSETMWQIGIDVEKKAGKNGIGTMLVTMLKNEILKRGRLPYYGTGMSHVASQKVAIGSGFTLSWAELITDREDG